MVSQGGNATAKSNLERMQREGYGVGSEFAQELKMLIDAAEKGDRKAQAQLARMYRDGEGVPKNDAPAFKCTKKRQNRAI